MQEVANGLVDKTPRRLFDAEITNVVSDGSLSDSQEFAPPPTRSFLSSAKKNLFSNYRDRLFGDRLNDSLDDSVASSHNVSLNDSVFDTPGFKERNLKLADVEKGLEVIGRCLAKEQNVGWKEFWSFLDEFVDIASVDGLTKLENYLQHKSNEKMKPPQSLTLPIHGDRFAPVSGESSPMTNMCRHLNKLNMSRDTTPHAQHSPHIAPSSPNEFHAYLCVEKSCQVFATRMMKPLTQSLNNLVGVNDALTSELGRLKSLVCSYKEDIRFFAIDFRAAHSRFAHILVALLKEQADVNDNGHNNLEDVENCLRQILLAKEKALTSPTNNNNGPNGVTVNVQQLVCLIKFILKRIDAKDDVILPETLTTERDCHDVWAAEDKCDCEWTNQCVNNKASRSIKRRSDISLKMNSLSLNATKEHSDDGDDDDDETYWVCSLRHAISIVISEANTRSYFSLWSTQTTKTMVRNTSRRPARRPAHCSMQILVTVLRITFSGECRYPLFNRFPATNFIYFISSIARSQRRQTMTSSRHCTMLTSTRKLIRISINGTRR